MSGLRNSNVKGPAADCDTLNLPSLLIIIDRIIFFIPQKTNKRTSHSYFCL